MKKSKGIRVLPKGAVYCEMDSPVGVLTLIASSKGLNAILWDCDLEHSESREALDSLKRDSDAPILVETQKQLVEYFDRKRKIFDLPLDISGTDFQKQAWEQLRKIPYGETISYGEQAKRVGDKKKARAVGMANGCNPISIVIPCHRVIGANGSLTGFGGGVDRKSYLLEMEQEA